MMSLKECLSDSIAPLYLQKYIEQKIKYSMLSIYRYVWLSMSNFPIID